MKAQVCIYFYTIYSHHNTLTFHVDKRFAIVLLLCNKTLSIFMGGGVKFGVLHWIYPQQKIRQATKSSILNKNIFIEHINVIFINIIQPKIYSCPQCPNWKLGQLLSFDAQWYTLNLQWPRKRIYNMWVVFHNKLV